MTLEHMEWERRAMSFRGFVVELLGVGDWPSTDGAADVLLSVDDWLNLEDRDSVLVDPVCIGFDVSPNRRTSICAAGRNEQGKWHVEVIHSNNGTGWVTQRLAELYERHEVAEVVCDGYGPAAAIARKAEDAGVDVRRLDAIQYGQACMAFVDAVGEQDLVHLGQEEMTLAIRGSKARPLVDRWAWSRTKSTVDISPLVGSTLALAAAIEQDGGEMRIW